VDRPCRLPRAVSPLLAVCLVLAAVPAAGAGAEPSGTAARDARLDALVIEALRAQSIPAMTVAAASADRMLYSRAFGNADLENSVAATPETLIRTASIAKPITAVAAMTLVESGRLDLDAPVQTYCPPFPPKQWPITVRQLLSHTSGIRHYNPGEPEYTHHYRFMADGFALFAGDPLLFRPGTGWQYSTYGYTVAGCAIEGASGERFADYVAAHVLEPAGMSHTRVDDALEIVAHRARGYQKINGEVKNAELMDSSYKVPGGGYVTTAEDLVRFAQALMDGKLVKPATLAQMWTPLPVSGTNSYGLGFHILEGGKFVTHTGGQAGTTTVLLIVPAQRFSIAIMANMNGATTSDLLHALLEQMRMPAPPP
jgi:serine beta-lactamase-like protein LACTB, mitochondrial